MKAQEFLAEKLSVQTLPQDVQDAEVVGFQVSTHGDKVWLCINGVCVMRIKGIKKVEVTDDRLPPFRDTTPGGADGF